MAQRQLLSQAGDFKKRRETMQPNQVKVKRSETMQPNQVKVNLEDATEFLCPECSGNLFNLTYKILKISKIAPSNPTGKDLMQPAPYFKCANKKCGHLLKNVRPA